MKRSILLIVLIGVAAWLIPFTASANGSGAGITGSPHDFTDNSGAVEVPQGTGWNFREEICRVCHVPHDHSRNEALMNQGLLWDHDVSANTFMMYAERAAADPLFISFIDGAFDTEPVGVSKLCLGCQENQG